MNNTVEVIMRYLTMISVVIAGTYLVVYGDPSKAAEWGPLASTVISAVVLLLQREQSKKLDVATAARQEIASKVSVVEQAVTNGAMTMAASAAAESYARGTQETIKALEPTIAAVVQGASNGGAQTPPQSR